jgi:NAD+ synthase (glutamine-hydrolysing)
MLEIGERFQMNSSMIISEIDVERLRIDRQRNTNFTHDKHGHYRHIHVAPLERSIEDGSAYSLEARGEGPMHRHFTKTPFLPKKKESDDYCEDVLNLQVHGLLRRWQHTHAESLVIGISGGLDSTLALIVSVLAADRLGYNRSQVIGVTMPGFGTSDRTYQNALAMMEELGVSIHEVPIRDMATQHLHDIGHDLQNHDITYENAQARIRTLVLMNLANKYNGLVVGTGDMSELALGWATYCGDHMSMYGVNAGVPKTLVRYMVRYAAENIFGERLREILMDVIATPVSPELLPTDEEGNIAQITEDKVGPYELHDFFMYYYLRYGFTREKIAYMATLAFDGVYTEEVIQHWLSVFMRRFFTQQFKRSCLPDGPKVVGVSLSPRGDLRMPSDVAIN